MGKIIKFPMNMQMIKRVNQNRSYERAYDAAMYLKNSEENRIKSEKLRREAERFEEDIKKLFK